jgi:hypothetical protein
MIKLFTIVSSMFFALNLLAAPDMKAYSACADPHQQIIAKSKCSEVNSSSDKTLIKKCSKAAKGIQECGYKHLELPKPKK